MLTINDCRTVSMDGPVIERGAIEIEGTKIAAIRRAPVARPAGDVLVGRRPHRDSRHGADAPTFYRLDMHTMDTGPLTNAQPHTLKAIQATAFGEERAKCRHHHVAGTLADMPISTYSSKKAINVGLGARPAHVLVRGLWLGHGGGHGSGMNAAVDGPTALRHAVRERSPPAPTASSSSPREA